MVEPLSRGDEQRLIQRAKRREPDALRHLIDLHKERLFNFVWRVVRHHHDAEEICQEAFLKAFASLDSFRPEFRFSTWLFTIAYRLCLNALRRKRAFAGDVDFSVLPGHGEPVDEGAAQSEEARRVKTLIWDSVDRLSPQQRATVLLFYRNDQSCQEIARILEVPVATVKSHLHRARARLREMLEPVVAGETDRTRILAKLAG
ncbi:MAG TPA: RNA polymerase sigma factor [Phycisphaerae bacterium]|jgi:RNA polymerase sigma-70 factor (ECF subfamily)